MKKFIDDENVFAVLGKRTTPRENVDKGKKTTQIFFKLFAGIFVGFFVWGMVGTLDIVSMTEGEVIPSTQVKSIQHLEGGIVRKIDVHEGQRVKKGQALVHLEQIISGADLSELQVRTTSLKIRIVRLEAEAKGLDTPEFSTQMKAKFGDIIGQENDQFQARQNDLKNRMATQKEVISQKEFNVRQMKDRLVNMRSTLKLHEEKVSISEELMLDELTNRYLHLDLLTRMNELKGTISDTKSSLSSASSALKESQTQAQQIETSAMNEVQNELNDSRGNLRELNERLIKFEDSVSRTVVRATVDGTVKTLHVVTEGGVIRAGDPVVDLVPEGDRLVIEAQLPTGDIGYVKVGQHVSVKLATADAAHFKDIVGKVKSISPDTLMTPEGMPYYKVRIDAEKDYFDGGTIQYQLYPGMRVVANITTGKRSVFGYIFGPVFASFGSALQER
ncbi:MAG: secretion protein HylD [Rhodospirillaceae bacterium]|nr:MAG: secretion protein HylD [Rhodospirillaceae bacterium]